MAVQTPKLQVAPLRIDKMSREAVVDEFGELDQKVKSYDSHIKRHKLLKEAIQGWFPDLPGDQAAGFQGNWYEVVVGMRQQERRIVSLPKVFKALGKIKFLEVCSLTLKALEAALGEEEAKKHLASDYTGSRKVTALIRQTPVEAAKAS